MIGLKLPIQKKRSTKEQRKEKLLKWRKEISKNLNNLQKTPNKYVHNSIDFLTNMGENPDRVRVDELDKYANSLKNYVTRYFVPVLSSNNPRGKGMSYEQLIEIYFKFVDSICEKIISNGTDPTYTKKILYSILLEFSMISKDMDSHLVRPSRDNSGYKTVLFNNLDLKQATKFLKDHIIQYIGLTHIGESNHCLVSFSSQKKAYNAIPLPRSENNVRNVLRTPATFITQIVSELFDVAIKWNNASSIKKDELIDFLAEELVAQPCIDHLSTSVSKAMNNNKQVKWKGHKLLISSDYPFNNRYFFMELVISIIEYFQDAISKMPQDMTPEDKFNKIFNEVSKQTILYLDKDQKRFNVPIKDIEGLFKEPGLTDAISAIVKYITSPLENQPGMNFKRFRFTKQTTLGEFDRALQIPRSQDAKEIERWSDRNNCLIFMINGGTQALAELKHLYERLMGIDSTSEWDSADFPFF